MIALCYVDGALEPVPVPGEPLSFLRPAHMFAAVLDPWSLFMPAFDMIRYVQHRLERPETPQPPARRRLSRRERRDLARLFGRGRGRRATVRVPASMPVPRPPLPAVEVLLYLPDGQAVEQRHLDDVARWLSQAGGTPEAGGG